MQIDRVKVKAYLAEKQIYQYELANKLGITESHLSKILRGRVEPSKELVGKILRGALKGCRNSAEKVS